MTPADSLYLLWHLIGVLSFTAVILPLITPRRYVPLDPSDPMPPNPEQTASWLSLILFDFLDAILWKASRVSHLPIAELPPLSDTDHSKNLVRAAFPHLDLHLDVKEKKPRGHMIWALLAVFKKELVWVILLLVLQTLATLLSPYGLKKLLEYMESHGEGAFMKPWVWIASLFFAPFTAAVLMQQYKRVIVRATVQLEAILTQLVLQHALRVRVVAEVKDQSAPVGTHSDSPSSKKPDPKPSAAAEAGKSLVGRMNNLISSDMQSINRGAEFMQAILTAPMVALTMGFLYTILGWRYIPRILIHSENTELF
ncbi:hypothetical protein H0H81_000506 [Sphagnurus paluster]|uniref:Uncharacterized protein n=1 Tax=Sphagnurus paluster TaxID=117069 RepID=A0A9P7KHU1_9AGAR|nr:hypothetical protein H0H81_000506 [Sphagnurus paluster]